MEINSKIHSIGLIFLFPIAFLSTSCTPATYLTIVPDTLVEYPRVEKIDLKVEIRISDDLLYSKNVGVDPAVGSGLTHIVSSLGEALFYNTELMAREMFSDISIVRNNITESPEEGVNALLIPSVLSVDRNWPPTILHEQKFIATLEWVLKDMNGDVIWLDLVTGIGIGNKAGTPNRQTKELLNDLFQKSFQAISTSPEIRQFAVIAPLHYASKSERPLLAKQILTKSVNPDDKRRRGLMMMYFATQRGDLELTKTLLSNEVDINGVEEYFNASPLHIAAQYGQQDVADLLLKDGADINTKNRDGWTAFMVALMDYDQLEMANFLFGKGADINTRDNSGRTIFHYAVLDNDQEMVEYLVGKGAKVHPVLETGEDSYATALSYQFSGRYFEQSGDVEQTKIQFSNAAQYFMKASEQFDEKYKEFSMKVLGAQTMDFLKILGAVIAQIALDEGARIHAQTQARQSAEIGALRIANKTGTGHLGYSRALRSFKPIIKNAGRGVNGPNIIEAQSFDMTDTSSLEAIKATYAELSKKSRLASAESKRIAECHGSSNTPEELANCKAAPPTLE